MIISGAMLWGATGPMMEWILLNSDMTVSYMLTVRLLIAGAFLLAMLKMQGKKIAQPWKDKVWARQLLIFGVVGMLGVQYTFVASIESSNAVDMTFSPFFVRIATTNVKVVQTEVHQLVGYFNGKVQLLDGSILHIRNMIGSSEEHIAKW